MVSEHSGCSGFTNPCGAAGARSPGSASWITEAGPCSTSVSTRSGARRALSRGASEDLHELLREAAGTPIRLGTTIESIDIAAGSARVRLSDGSVGDYDLLVGADGIHSSVRRLVFDGLDHATSGR